MLVCRNKKLNMIDPELRGGYNCDFPDVIEQQYIAWHSSSLAPLPGPMGHKVH